MKEIQVGSQTHHLHHVTGKVTGSQKTGYAQTRGGGGGVDDHIFLKDENNKEHAFQLWGFNVSCLPGHEVSVIWAIRKGDERGPYVGVINHSTQQVFFSEEKIRTICNPGIRIIPFLLVGAVAVWFFMGFVTSLVDGDFRNILLTGSLLSLCGWSLYRMRKANFDKIVRFKEEIKNAC